MINTQYQSKPSTLKESALSKPLISEMVNNKKELPKKKTPLSFILGGLLLLLLVVGSGAALYLTQMNQDVRQQAAVGTYPGAGLGEPCNDIACQDGLVCQGQEGSRICQNPGTDIDSLCPESTCTYYTSFKCSNLSVGPETSGVVACNENGESHNTDKSAAVRRANENGCGQWDQVCAGGSNAGNLCGSFSIINNNCEGTPTSTPTPSPSPNITPSPTPSPTLALCNESCNSTLDCAEENHTCTGGLCRLTSNPTSPECQREVGPMCLDVDLVNAESGIPLTQDPSFGDSIKFTCAEVTGVDHYIFRVIEPDRTIIELSATGRTSSTYTITNSGKFFAQCQICSTTDDSSCNPYEALN